MKKEKTLKTGGDPRALPDFLSLREEMMKLTHPARPDIDWHYAERLCLTLFEHHGVELQTAAWYLLARTHTAGLAGMNEGLVLINALTRWQWSVMWPAATAQRTEILATLNQRLQKQFRTLVFGDRDELEQLYQTEKNLAALTETLMRHELKQASGLEALQRAVGQAIVRVENIPHAAVPAAEIGLPPQALRSPAESAGIADAPRVYVIPPETTVEEAISRSAAVPPSPLPSSSPTAGGRRGLWSFLAGVGITLLVGGGVVWGERYLHAVSPEQRQWRASLTSPGEPLTPGQLTRLQRSGLQAGDGIAALQKQLTWLGSLPPGWSEKYGEQLLVQAQTLWPDSTEVQQMQKAWRQQIEADALPLAALDSWHQGMQQLQALTARLNSLDEKRGKYMTVSELKSEVFTLTQLFNRTPPLAERLRQLAAGTQEGSRRQAEIALDQYQKRYVLLTSEEGNQAEHSGPAGRS